MPPAIIAVAATVATAVTQVLVYTGVISALAGALITAAIAIAASVAMALGRKPVAQRTNQGEELKLKLDPGMPRQIPLGRCATGGSIVWAFTYGSTANVPQNAYLVRVIALSDLPIQGIVGIYEGKTQLQFNGDVTTGQRTCTTHKTKDGTPCMYLRVYKGDGSAGADADLISWSGGRWTTAHKGTNMAYAIVRYTYDAEGDAFPNGEPSLVFVMDGVKCYDQRFDSSRGGRSGSQRLGDLSSYTYTRNAAVLTQQVLRGFYSKGVLLFGAQAEDRDLDDAMLVSAYNTCDEVVSYSGGTQPRYRAGYMVSSSQPTADVLVQLQAAMDGRIIDRGGAITIRPGATHTPVFSNLTDNDVAWAEESSWQPRLNLSDIYNFVDGVFVDEQTIFQEKPFEPRRDATYEAQDGGQRFELQLALSAVTDLAQCDRITKRIHLASRLQGTIAFYLPLWALEMEQDDWFVMSSERFGFTNKYFQAVTVDLVMADAPMVAVIGRETSASIDGWNPAVDERPRVDTFWVGGTPSNLPIPVLAPSGVTKIDTTQGVEQYGVSIVVTNLGNNPALATNLEIQIAPSSNLTQATTLLVAQAYNQTIENYGLLAGAGYSIRGRTYNQDKVGDWSAWYAFTAGISTTGYSIAAPASIVFQANVDGTLNPANQLPKNVIVDIQRSGVSAVLNDNVEVAAVGNGCTVTVDTTDGSPTKGNITITDFPGWSASISVSALAWGVELAPVTITLSKSTASTGGGGTGGGTTGGSGSKSASVSIDATISSTAFATVSDVATVTIAAGESLYGTGSIQYDETGDYNLVTSYTFSVKAKWQYSVHGANSWVDFPGSPKTGSLARSETGKSAAVSGAVGVSQTQGGLAAGDYDVRIVAAKASGTGFSVTAYGSALIQAKV